MLDQGNSTGSPTAEKVTPASERVAPWLAALRSGKYSQTLGYLKDGDGFCCLGVLCDISGAGEWTYRGYSIGKIDNCSILPLQLRDKFGLSDDFLGDLMHMNDTGKSFSEIADYIEKNL